MKGQIFILMIICALGCGKYNYDVKGTTESFISTSQIVNDEYKIYVYLPPNYSEDNSEYSLIIGLSGDSKFETISKIISNEIAQNKIPEVIFVGIGYGNETKEIRDYTPTFSEEYKDYDAGGAQNFYEYIKDELIPELENKYNIDRSNSKTLMGNSLGGLFTLFALFQDRDTNPFDKFIPVASSFWYDSGSIFEFEEAYAQSHVDLDVKVYTTMGSLEGGVMIASFAEMNDRLLAREYPNLNFYSELLEKFGHVRSDYPSYEKALPYVFN